MIIYGRIKNRYMTEITVSPDKNFKLFEVKKGKMIYMKKNITKSVLICLVIALCFALAACNGSEETDPNNNKITEKPASSTPTASEEAQETEQVVPEQTFNLETQNPSNNNSENPAAGTSSSTSGGESGNTTGTIPGNTPGNTAGNTAENTPSNTPGNSSATSKPTEAPQKTAFPTMPNMGEIELPIDKF